MRLGGCYTCSTTKDGEQARQQTFLEGAFSGSLQIARRHHAGFALLRLSLMPENLRNQDCDQVLTVARIAGAR